MTIAVNLTATMTTLIDLINPSEEKRKAIRDSLKSDSTVSISAAGDDYLIQDSDEFSDEITRSADIEYRLINKNNLLSRQFKSDGTTTIYIDIT